MKAPVDDLDNRRSLRQPVDYLAEYRIDGSATVETGRLRDLSAGGFLLRAPRELVPGTSLAVTLRHEHAELVAAVVVVRCSPGNGAYDVACRFD